MGRQKQAVQQEEQDAQVQGAWSVGKQVEPWEQAVD